jgi:LL-diaminopimelate aminotransferase
MAFLNENYLKLQSSYLFAEIARRVAAFQAAHPEAVLIRCGIGDVTEPLPAACIAALHKAVDEMSVRDTFHGYGPEQGYPFLRQAIAENDFRARGLSISDDEIFVSDGAKSDCGDILDILGPGNKVMVPNPVYPAYVDTNVMAGNTGPADAQGVYQGLIFANGTAENGFVPAPPAEAADVVYLCFPNNPTGAVAPRATLQAWVDYAHRHDALIVYDAAYEAFISTVDIPHSIFEIEGARTHAIELRSFSKNGGFTGLRCAYSVVPKEVTARTTLGERQALHALWLRRQTTRFNGVAYPVQRAAEALYSPEGKRQVQALVSFYLENAALLRQALEQAGLSVTGGVDAPYLWVRAPGALSSWAAFDWLLQSLNIVVTPGSGFGAQGEGYFRLSAFNSRANIDEACRRLTTTPLFATAPSNLKS